MVPIPRRPRAYGLLLAAIRNPDPVIFLEPKRIYRIATQEVEDDGETLPLDSYFMLREGSDITLVTWGAMTYDILQAADKLAETGIDAEVIDVAILKTLRSELESLKQKVRSRSIPPEELRGLTFTLSNSKTFAGRYADPIVMPPTVAILGAGRVRSKVVATSDGSAVHRIIPLSLTFDHRAVTGGEATRFLSVVIDKLKTAQ